MKTAHALIIGIAIVVGFLGSAIVQRSSASPAAVDSASSQVGRYQVATSPVGDGSEGVLVYVTDTQSDRMWRCVDERLYNSDHKIVRHWEETGPAYDEPKEGK